MAEPAAGLYVELRALVAKFQQDMDGAVKTVLGVEKKLTGVFNTINKVAQAALVIGGVVAVKKLSDAIGDLAKKGEEASGIAEGFAKLGGSSRQIELAQKAVLGMVDSFDLMKIANEGLVKQIPGFNENFGKIAELGARLANTLGVDTKEAIEQVTQALGNAKDKQLAAVGITIDAEKAYQDYAKQIGVTAKQLDDVQKKEARQIAAIQAIEGAISRLAPVNDTVANAQEAFNAALSEGIKTMGIAINENDDLREAWRTLEEQVKKIDWNQIGEDIAKMAAMVGEVLSAVIPKIQAFFHEFVVGAEVLQGLDFSNLNSLKKSFADMSEAVGSLDAATAKTDAIRALKTNIDNLNKAVAGARTKQEAESFVPVLEQLTNKWQELGLGQGAVKTALVQTTEALGNQMKTLPAATNIAIQHGRKSSEALAQESKAAEKAAKELQKYKDKWNEFLNKDSVDSLKNQIDDAIENLNTADFPQLTESLRQAVEEGFLAEWQDAIKAGGVKLEDVLKEAKNQGNKAVEEVTDKLAKKSQEALEKAVSDFSFGMDQIFTGVEDVFGFKLPEGMQRALDIAHGIGNIFEGISKVADAWTSILSQLDDKNSTLNSIIGTIGSIFGVPTGGAGVGGIIEGIADGIGDAIGGIGDAIGGLFARGGVFDGSHVEKAARGMVIGTPTYFRHGRGLGQMGEAGPEAILPLTRVNGKLGVAMAGESRRGGVNIYVNAPHAQPGVEDAIMNALEGMQDYIIKESVNATIDAFNRGSFS